jgi:hypothetical protein
MDKSSSFFRDNLTTREGYNFHRAGPKKNHWDEPSMGCMPRGTKELGDVKCSGCTIRAEPIRDVSSGDVT